MHKIIATMAYYNELHPTHNIPSHRDETRKSRTVGQAIISTKIEQE